MKKMWYIGSMNDALFIIDRPPFPAPDDVGPCDGLNSPNPISKVIDLENAELIVNAHNKIIQELEIDVKMMRDSLLAMVHEWEKMTRYGSPLAKAANENLMRARAALAALDRSALNVLRHFIVR